MTDSSAPIIRTIDLTKQYKNLTAVDVLSFEVRRGEVFGFLGPNGAGKTTTIGMLLGLVRPSAGDAEVLGVSIRHNLHTALRRVGAIIENPAFYPYLTGSDNLRIFARISGHINGNNAEGRIPELLELVGLSGRGTSKVGAYSLGMRQRLGLACALLGDPELLILDEPTNGLDPAGMLEMRHLIRQLAEDEGKTVFLSSHLLHEVEQVCDRVLILDKGRLIAQGDVKELLSQARGIEIRIDALEDAAALLEKIPWVMGVQKTEDRLVIDAPPERAPELLAALAGQNLFPLEVRPIVQTLENVFLKLTGEEGLDA
jgi:ABC-2 type transport system ATP-binding protein